MNIIWLLLVACGAVIIQMVVFRSAGQKGISYTRYFSQNRAKVGDKLEMVEVITVRRLLPVPWMRVESRIPAELKFTSQSDLNIENDLYHRSVFSLLPYMRIRRRYSITCTHRGQYNLDTVTLTTGDMLGLYNSYQTLPLDAKLLVYPKLKDFSALDIPSRQWQGNAIVRRWIQPDSFLVNGIREYRLGDNPRDIHPGATARTGVLQVKTHDFTATPRVLVVLNVQLKQEQWGPLNEVERESMEDAISLAATMVAWCSKNRIACGFASNGTLLGVDDLPVYLSPSVAAQQYDDLMEILARLVIARKISFQTI
jgi:uncharacterized protein (DUF58 family)